MRNLLQIIMMSVFLLLPAGHAASQTAADASNSQPVRVDIPTGDAKPIQGILLKPIGAGPFPAVVAMHGCGGLGSSNSPLNARHEDWGQKLVEKGYIVLFPDSFGSRGLGAQCLVKDRAVRPNRERVADAQAARAWLQSRSDVVANRVSLIGWSNGGSSVLWAISSLGKVKAGGKVNGEQADFYRAVAFYPGCRLVAEAAQRRAWQSRIPLMILIGQEDTWTPPEQCRQLVATVNSENGSASIIQYPKAVHEFDHPNRKLTKRTGLAFTGDDSGEALIGTEPSAREDALIQVPNFLKGF